MRFRKRLRIFIKQLFCDHLMEVTAEKDLGCKRLEDGKSFYGTPIYWNYHIVAQRKKCIKCGKRTIEEKRFIIL